MKNFEKIKAMSKRDMAKFLHHLINCGACRRCSECNVSRFGLDSVCALNDKQKEYIEWLGGETE